MLAVHARRAQYRIPEGDNDCDNPRPELLDQYRHGGMHVGHLQNCVANVHVPPRHQRPQELPLEGRGMKLGLNVYHGGGEFDSLPCGDESQCISCVSQPEVWNWVSMCTVVLAALSLAGSVFYTRSHIPTNDTRNPAVGSRQIPGFTNKSPPGGARPQFTLPKRLKYLTVPIAPRGSAKRMRMGDNPYHSDGDRVKTYRKW